MVQKWDYVSKTGIASTSQTTVSTVKVPSGARRISGYWTFIKGTPEAGTEQWGIVELSGDGVHNVSPLKLPATGSVGTGNVGTASSHEFTQEVKVIPVDIPVQPGYEFTVKITLVDDQSTDVYIGFIFE